MNDYEFFDFLSAEERASIAMIALAEARATAEADRDILGGEYFFVKGTKLA